jgi:opacity protein-like surface antigen
MALHFVGRYGFFPTPEVPFGHLQPYVGIGPGLVMLYAEADSAKNFSLEAEAGVRYMFNRNTGIFLEYKFSQQWQVELQAQQLLFNNIGFTANNALFDFTRNQVVVGLTYHF